MTNLTTRQLNYKIKRNPRAFFSQWRSEKIAYFDLLLAWDNHQESFTAFIDYLADRIGVASRSIQRWNKEFRELGILAMDAPEAYRGVPCRFYINSWFHKKRNRELLSNMFVTFKNYAKRFLFYLSCVTPIIIPKNNISLTKSESVFITRERARSANSGNSLVWQKKATLLSKKESISRKEEKASKTVISELRLKEIMEIDHILPLTTHGIVKLSVYSAVALQYAQKQTQMALTKYDPFGYLANLCHEFDTKNNNVMDWEAYHLRREAFGIAKEDTNFIDQERLSAIEAAQESREKKTYTKAPVQKFHKPEQAKPAKRVQEWQPSHESYEPEKKNEEVALTAQCFNLDQKAVPPLNSPAYFAHIIAFGTK